MQRIYSALKGNLVVVSAAAILSFQLFLPPSIGLAGNGDFGKIIGRFSLAAPSQDENAFADVHYTIAPENYFGTGVYATGTVLAAAALGLNRIFSDGRTFDLRWMGLVHASLFIGALCLLQPLLRLMPALWRTALCAAVVFVFCDVANTSWLSSFYMDTATYVFFLLSLVLFVRAARWRRKLDAIALVASVVLMLLAKTQHAVFGFWLAALWSCCGSQLWPGNGRRFAWVAAGLTLLATAASLALSPHDYAARGVYSVIFFQVLPNSKNPAAALHDLGLGEEYQKFTGQHAFSEGNRLGEPEFLETFIRKTSYPRLGIFFLTHPRDAYLALDTSLAEGARQRPILGNYDRSVGREPSAESQAFAVWSATRKALFFQHGTRYLCFWAAVTSLMVGLAFLRLERVHALGCVALAGMAVTAMLIASMADAVDVIRHHFIANALLDLMLLICLAIATMGRGVCATPSPETTARDNSSAL